MFEKNMKKLSLGLEQLPDVTTPAYSLLASTLGKMIYQKENGKRRMIVMH